jgi:hypothetical protein
MSGNVARRHRNTEPWAHRGFAPAKRVDARSQAFVRGECEVEALAEPLCIQAEQSTFRVQDRAAR